MANKDEVWDQTSRQTAVLTLGSPVTFPVSMEGGNALQLNCNYVRSAGTALTFTFFTQEPQNDPGQNYSLKKIDIAGGTISNGSFTYTTSASEHFAVVFPLTGQNVQVTITGTATTGSDTIQITPRRLVVG